jgi:hypothetical protein
MTSNIGNGAYNNYDGLSLYSYNTIDYLIENNEMIWKLLYNTTPSAWNISDLTHAQKASLIYAGQPDSSQYNVFMARGMPDPRTSVSSILTISPSSIIPVNRTRGIVNMLFEVYCHYTITHMNNYMIRTDVIIEELIKTLNGQEFVKGLGPMFFDQMGSKIDKDSDSGVTPFRGKWLTLSQHIG